MYWCTMIHSEGPSDMEQSLVKTDLVQLSIPLGKRKSGLIRQVTS
jgi:hypothetical protein